MRTARRETPVVTTRSQTIVPGDPGPGGYRRLEPGPGEEHRVRRELGGMPSGHLEVLCSFIQLSDLHVTDVQSPARAEFLDRFGDPDSPLAERLGRVGVYRAQETLTAQVVEAMARAVRRVERGPILGAPIDFALSTGDAADNGQLNELLGYLALLDGGGSVTLNSGDPTRYEGIGSPAHYDERYWHPDGSPDGQPDDLPRRERGFPVVPGLLRAAGAEFEPSGLGLPWYAVYGNHDALYGGTLPQLEILGAVATGDRKRFVVENGFDPLPLLLGSESKPSTEQWGMFDGPTEVVTADPMRRPVGRREWVRAHLASPGAPRGHGLDELALGEGRAYYGFDHGPLRFLVLDTVNSAGGWQGCLDDEQFTWLEHELVAGHRHYLDADGHERAGGKEDRLFVLVSHHTLETLINGFAPDGVARRLREDLITLLSRFSNIACWVNGHTHEHAVRPIPGTGCWQITTASHIDWPQQSRVIELAIDTAGNELVLISSVIDHLGAIDPRRSAIEDPLGLAGWSRELAANPWQGRRDGRPVGRGEVLDRNVVCTRPLPSGLKR